MAIPEKVLVSGSIDYLLNVGGATTRVLPDTGTNAQAVFTPALEAVTTTADDQVSTVMPITATIDTQGRLVVGGQLEFELTYLSSLGLTHNIPEGEGTWQVSFRNVYVNGEYKPLAPFWIAPTPGAVNKLSQMLTTKAGGQVVAKGDEGRGLANSPFLQTAVNKVRPVLDDGTQGDEITLPPGAPGGSDTSFAQFVGTDGTQTKAAAAQLIAQRTHVLASDYATLELALAAVASGGVIEIRTAWTRTTTWTITKSCTINFRGAGQITWTAPVDGINISAHDVTINDPVLIGPNGNNVANHKAITNAGTLADPTRNVVIDSPRRTSKITEWSRGIYLDYTSRYRIERLDFTRISYAGILVLSAFDGQIKSNIMREFTQPTGYSPANYYGIAVTRNSAKSLADAPQSVGCVIEDNTVDGVTKWEGIDTHAGRDIKVVKNRILNCRHPVAMVGGAENGVEVYGAKNILVQGNYIDTQGLEGSGEAGVKLVGESTIFGLTEVGTATGSILDNTIIGYGTPGNSATGAIVLYNTVGVIVAGNRVIRASVCAFNVYFNNYGLLIDGNMVVDLSNSTGFSAALFLRSGANRLTISNTRIVRDTLPASATFVNDRGIYSLLATDTQVLDGGGNEWYACNTPVNAAAGVVQSLTGGYRHAQLGALPSRSVWDLGSTVMKTAPVGNASPGWTCVSRGGLSSAQWAASTAVATGVWWRTASGKVLEAITAGTTGTVEPDPTGLIDSRVTDGTVVWAYRSATSAAFRTLAALGSTA